MNRSSSAVARRPENKYTYGRKYLKVGELHARERQIRTSDWPAGTAPGSAAGRSRPADTRSRPSRSPCRARARPRPSGGPRGDRARGSFWRCPARLRPPPAEAPPDRRGGGTRARPAAERRAPHVSVGLHCGAKHRSGRSFAIRRRIRGRPRERQQTPSCPMPSAASMQKREGALA